MMLLLDQKTMSWWLGALAVFLCCFSAVLLAIVCFGKPPSVDKRLYAGRPRDSESDTDDTRRAKREKLQIRREMPPEVLEHMARIYDLPHGASPAHGMSACSLSEVAIDMSMYKSLPLDEVINQVKECNFSERNSSSGIPKYLFELEKITKELDRGSRHPRHKFTGH